MQASNPCKRVLESAKLPYPNTTREFSQILVTISNVLNKSKSAISLLLNELGVLSHKFYSYGFIATCK